MNGHSFPDPDALLQHAGFLRALARSLLLDEAQADDAVQQALLAAWEKPPAPRSNLRAWLARVVRNRALMRRRTEGRITRRERVAARPEGVPPAADVAARLEIQRRVVEAVQALAEPYRSAVVLRYFDELRPEEIASQQGVPVATVKTRLRRALAKLRERFDTDVDGGRRAWSAALLPLALPPRAGVTTAAALTFGGLLTMKSLATIGTVLVLALVLFFVQTSQGRETVRSEETARDNGRATSATTAADAESESEAEAAGRRIEGFVRNEDGDPVAGAAVSVLSPVLGEGWVAAGASTRSGRDGAFRVQTDRRPYLRVRHPEYVRADTWLRNGEVRLVRGTPVIVEVVRADGTPVAGAHVKARGTGFALRWGPANILGPTFGWTEFAEADTDARGKARLGALPREAMVLIVDHPGFARWTEQFEPTGTDPVTRRATLGSGGRVRGRVLSPDGDPVAGARVRREDDRLRVAVTDDEGRYVLEHVAAGKFKMRADATGFAPAAFGHSLGWGEPVPITLRTGETRDGIDIVVAPATYVTGRVVDGDGQGIAGVLVSAGSSLAVGGRASGATATDGSFRVGPLAVAKPQRLQVVFARDALGLPRLERAARPGEDLDVGTVQALAAAVVRGRVAAPDGAVNVRVTVSIEAIDYTAWSTPVGADGSFQLEVPPGPARLVASADGSRSATGRAVVASGANPEVTLVLEPTHAITGRVRREDGAPVFLQKVAVAREGTSVQRLGSTDEEGRFYFGDLPAGRYRVGLTKLWGGELLADPEPQVVETGATGLEFVIAGATTALEGRVVSKRDGQPVQSFEVALIRYRLFVPVSRSWQRVRSPDGRFHLAVDEPGEYAVEVEAEGLAPNRTRTFTVAKDKVVSAGVVRLGDTGRVAGVVRDAAGLAVAFARIHVLSLKFESNFEAAFTDADGRFEVAGVAPGRYSLFAVSPRHPLGLVLGVAVAEGEQTEVPVALAPACPLTIRVVDGAGRPLAGAQLVYRLPQLPHLDSRMVAEYEPPGFGANESDSKGRIVKPSMPPGTVALRIEVDGRTPVTRTVELTAGEPVEIEIRVP